MHRANAQSPSRKLDGDVHRSPATPAGCVWFRGTDAQGPIKRIASSRTLRMAALSVFGSIAITGSM